jgi:hypothetical protein
MTITESVVTVYNGTRFRSRLEARWAVFLDAAGIEWQYERRIIRAPGEPGYVPDFWLPAAGQFAEVKGFLYPEGFARIMNIASRIDLVVLGRLPPWFGDGWPIQLHRHGPERELFAVPWIPEPGCPARTRGIPAAYVTPELLLAGFPVVCPDWAEEPLSTARRYRFPPTSGPADPRQRLPDARTA